MKKSALAMLAFAVALLLAPLAMAGPELNALDWSMIAAVPVIFGMADATTAQGTLIKISSGSPTNFQTIPGVIGTPAIVRNNTLVDITDLSSTHMQDLAVLKSGTLSFTINWLPDNAVHQLLNAAADDGLVREFRIEFTDSSPTVFTFTAIVESETTNPNVAGVLQKTYSLKRQTAITVS